MLKIEERPKIRFRSREGFCLAALVFGEVLSGYQVVGIILAVGSVIFLSI